MKKIFKFLCVSLLFVAATGAAHAFGLIDNSGKIYYCPLKINRLVDDTSGVEKYKKVQDLNWNEVEKSSGKTIKIKGFPRDKKVKIFWATVSANRTEYIVTNDLTQSSLL